MGEYLHSVEISFQLLKVDDPAFDFNQSHEIHDDPSDALPCRERAFA
jgi:hypothetical protein